MISHMLRHIVIESALTGPSSWLVESPYLISLRKRKVVIREGGGVPAPRVDGR